MDHVLDIASMGNLVVWMHNLQTQVTALQVMSPCPTGVELCFAGPSDSIDL